MKRSIRQIREDIEILSKALKHNEQWRFNVVAARVAVDFGNSGTTLHTALRSDPEDLVKAFGLQLREEEIRRDTPGTPTSDEYPW